VEAIRVEVSVVMAAIGWLAALPLGRPHAMMPRSRPKDCAADQSDNGTNAAKGADQNSYG